MSKPFVKMVGGKAKLVPELLKFMPEHCETYYEPFIGGGALFWAMASQKRFNMAKIGDMNSELIHAYQAVKYYPDALMDQLAGYDINKETFDRIKAKDEEDLLRRASRFIYLNKTCFNGLWRVNKKGQFNVPFGKWKTTPKLFDEINIRSCSKLLDKATIRHSDYADTISKARVGDVIYFDPPYIQINATSNFSNYTQAGFGLKEQEKLSHVFALLALDGVKVVLSNSDTELTRELYKKFDIHEIEAARSINCQGDKRGKIKELIITAN